MARRARRGHALLPDGGSADLGAGDVERTPAGEVHGVENTGHAPFVYLTVTTPPQDFTDAYRDRSRPG